MRFCIVRKDKIYYEFREKGRKNMTNLEREGGGEREGTEQKTCYLILPFHVVNYNKRYAVT